MLHKLLLLLHLNFMSNVISKTVVNKHLINN